MGPVRSLKVAFCEAGGAPGVDGKQLHGENRTKKRTSILRNLTLHQGGEE